MSSKTDSPTRNRRKRGILGLGRAYRRLDSPPLTLEPLEDRMLLASFFKAVDFVAEGDFSGNFFSDVPEGPDIHGWYNGPADCTGALQYESPTEGKGTARVAGVYNWSATDGSSGGKPFDIEVHITENDGDVEVTAVDMNVTVDAEFDTSDFSARARWNWTRGNNWSRGTWAGKFKPTNKDPYDIRFLGGTFNRGGAYVDWVFTGPVKPVANRPQAISDVRVYWANGAGILGDAVAAEPIYWNSAGGSVTVSALSNPPEEATCLLAIADMDQRVAEDNEDNNVLVIYELDDGFPPSDELGTPPPDQPPIGDDKDPNGDDNDPPPDDKDQSPSNQSLIPISALEQSAFESGHDPIKLDGSTQGPPTNIELQTNTGVSINVEVQTNTAVSPIPQTNPWQFSHAMSLSTVGVSSLTDGNSMVTIHDTSPNAVAGEEKDIEPPLPPWQNPILAVDVNNDSIVSPLDVLALVTQINTGGAGTLPGSPQERDAYWDPSGDDMLTPVDVLMVVSWLNNPNSNGASAPASLAHSSVPILPATGDQQVRSEQQLPEWPVDEVLEDTAQPPLGIAPPIASSTVRHDNGDTSNTDHAMDALALDDILADIADAIANSWNDT